VILTDDILDKYLRLILDAHFEGWKDCGDKYTRLKCNVCGDGKSNKKRGIILKSKVPWMYYCFNEGCSMPVKVWMKYYFSGYYNDYIKEMFKIEKLNNKSYSDNTAVQEKKDIIPYDEFQDVKHFKSIFSSHLPIFETARQYCKSRFIPYNVWYKWYVAVDGFFKNRLVIPYYDTENKIYHYQCRDLTEKSEIRYLSRLVADDDSVYNIYNIDRNKPVIYLEGVIDSLFIENAIAGSGMKFGNDKFNGLDMYYLLDNDKTGKNKSIKLLKEGKQVFLWKKWLRGINFLSDLEKDDINKIVIKMNTCGVNKLIFSFNELKSFFSNRSCDRIYLV
jgi:hypothetical protein